LWIIKKNMDHLLSVKFAALFILWFAIFVMIQLPLKIEEWFKRRGKRGEWFLSVLACFGGGIFFGVYMMHLGPEVDEIIEEHIEKPYDIHYPIANLLVGLGFFLLVGIDKLMHHFQHSSKNHDAENAASKTTGGHSHLHLPASPSTATIISVDEQEVEEHVISDTERQSLAGFKAVMMFMALAADSVFEGLALGVQLTETGVWNLVLAILGHEVVIAFMLGLEIRKHYQVGASFWLGFCYALADPIGILVGITISATTGESGSFELVSGVLQAVCCGVFIYVTFLEILAREFAHSSSLIKTVAVFAGFGLMALLTLILPHEHGHDCSH